MDVWHVKLSADGFPLAGTDLLIKMFEKQGQKEDENERAAGSEGPYFALVTSKHRCQKLEGYLQKRRRENKFGR